MSGVENLGCLEHLQALVLMDGSVRPNPFAAALHRSLLNLPIDSNRQLLDYWQSEAAELAERIGFDRLPVRVVIDKSSQVPRAPAAIERVFFDIERDCVEFRGSGGALKDIAEDYADEDFLLVSSGAQLLREPLATIAMRLARTPGDVVMLSHRDGTPGGFLLIRCGTLRGLSSIGFVDFREQALPTIAAKHDVRVIYWDRPNLLPIKSAHSYIHALRQFHLKRQESNTPEVAPAFEEDWRPTFAIIEPGAMVDPTAELLDSVALAGCRIEAGAYAVRSVLCPGSVLQSRHSVQSKLVMPGAGSPGTASPL
jgi:hypothetical protein